MNELMEQNPLLLLFIVASIGYFIGNIRVKGISLGVAAVLFTGLVFGALNTDLTIPSIITNLGLVLFVYSIGLKSGPAFFKSYKKNGLRDFTFIVAMLLFSGLVAGGLFFMMDISAAMITGAYAGSTTNTPALAAVIDYINSLHDQNPAMLNDAVLGYSFSYPMGVLGSIVVILIMEKLLKIDYQKEKHSLRKTFPLDKNLASITVEITNEKVVGIQIRDLLKKYRWEVVFGRMAQQETVALTNYNTTFTLGDRIMVVGSADELKKITEDIGRKVENDLDHDRTEFDVRRIFVSNPKVVGRTIASLQIDKKFNAIITRIRRGDAEMLVNGNTILELGDRLRFVAHREDLKMLSTYFGDSYKASSKINLFTFGIGIGLGLILGSIEINIGPAFSFKLGLAGGPLLVGLILGALRRTGPIVWSLPYSSNTTLQQMGLILLLAGIGVSAGHSFVDSFNSDAIWVFIASIAISMVTAMAMIFIGYKYIKMPFTLLMGLVSNQPAILDFATDRSDSMVPEIGYTMIFPIAMILKIVIAQALLVALL